MTQSQENLVLAKSILIRLEKIGVGNEGGSDAPHQSGGFGVVNTEEKPDHFYMPRLIQTEDNCGKKGQKCIENHDARRKKNKLYDTGMTAQMQL